jgi:hypothetical protein
MGIRSPDHAPLMEHGLPTNHTPPPKKGIIARLLISAGSMLLAFIFLTVFVEILRSVVVYSEFQVLFEPVYVERQRALGSLIPPLAIIPWAFKYFSVMPLHVITGLLMAWKMPLIIIWGVFAFIGNEHETGRAE